VHDLAVADGVAEILVSASPDDLIGVVGLGDHRRQRSR
jgi:hypothetical protein